MKTLLAVCAALLCVIWHAPVQGTDPSFCAAAPYPVVVQQQDGSALTVVAKGNAAIHYTETLDGYTVLLNDQKIYEYAVLNAAGELVRSGSAAADPGQRTATDQALLSGLQKHLRRKPAADAEIFREISTGHDHADGEARFPSTGQHKVLVLLIQYPDLPNEYAAADFDALMNEQGYAGTGSFRDYFLKNSHGQLDIEADVFGWYTAEQNYAYYGYQNGFQRARILMGEAIDAAEAAGVDFSQYDSDGDGEVDAVIGIHAGPGAEMGAQMQYIWSHRWDMGSQARIYDGVRISDYVINPETRTWGMVGIGVICHEFGHVMGLPDLYDIDNSSRGIGNWGLMGNGSWLHQEKVPANMCAWSKYDMDWITPEVITAGSFALAASDGQPDCYRINTGNEGEYFLLENRQQTGNDAYLPGSGMAIWHINEARTSLYPSSNNVNADESNRGVDLEEADGLEQLNGILSLGDAGDLYPGSTGNTVFDPMSMPSSNTNDGSVADISITNIYEAEGIVYFRLNDPVACIVQQVTVGSPESCQNGFYDQPLTIYHHDAPASGSLVVNGLSFPIASSPQTVVLPGLPADGLVRDLEIYFSEQEDCALLLTGAFTAPTHYNIQVERSTCYAGDAGTQVFHYNSVSGCDSTVTIHTALLPSYDLLLERTTCDWALTGEETFYFSTTEGCDSVVTISTTYATVDTTVLEYTTCVEEEAGTTEEWFTGSTGCDSLVLTRTTFVPVERVTVNASTCDPDAAGSETLYLEGAEGCDSVVMILTTFQPSFELEVEEIVCDPADAGIETFYHTSQAGCDSFVTVHSVYQPMHSDFGTEIDGLTVEFNNQTVYGDQFFWVFGDGTGSLEEHPEHTYPSPGMRLVLLIAWDVDCNKFNVVPQWVVVSDGQGNSVTEGTEDAVLSTAKLNVYPNPTFGPVHIQTKGLSTSEAQMRLVDVRGRVVMEKKLEDASTARQMDLSGVGPGVYTLMVSDSEQSLQTRIFLTN